MLKQAVIVLVTLSLVSFFDVNAAKIQTTKIIYDGGGRTTQNYISKIAYTGGNVKPSTFNTFPIVTKEMSVGPLGEHEGRDAKFVAAARPLFIVGYDQVSVDWLRSNAQLLIERDAIGYVVNVENKIQMDYLSNLLGNKIMLLPMNMSEMSEQLNIQHYPFYMDSQGVLR